MPGSELVALKNSGTTGARKKRLRAVIGMEFNGAQQGASERRQWTLKGIAPSAVDQTREAALRNGMKLNSFVTQALLKAVDESMSDAAPKEKMTPAELEARLGLLESYIKEEFDALRRRSEEIETSMRSINGFLIRIYAEQSKPR